MELFIKPYHKNSYPLRGLLIKGNSVAQWVVEMQTLQLQPRTFEIYPIPANVANTIWGCLLIFLEDITTQNAGRHQLCQEVSHNLLIAERSVLYPQLTAKEIQKMFSSGRHIMHPEFGMVELSEPVDFRNLLSKPKIRSYYITRPEVPAFVPRSVNSFRLQAVPPEEVLKNLEENVFPKREKIEDKPLNIFERIKLTFYKSVFKKNNEQPGKGVPKTEKKKFLKQVESFLTRFFPRKANLVNDLQDDFEDLEKRNQDELQKLLNLLRTNPEEALKYAIPLDDGSRGAEAGRLTLTKRWSQFLWNQTSAKSTGGAVNIGDHFMSLHVQYNQTAEELIKQKQYQKAAFVYMKLLKNFSKAAEVLEMGGYYQEAATVYLKHLDNKQKAAECYEKGNMAMEAIALYKDLNVFEKVGDLYAGIHKREEANIYYEQVVSEYKGKQQYLKASLAYKNKMLDT
ncbi:MAG: hypothetical protein EOP51_06125, partial [Sphingobacteriales bacterium]